MRCAVTNVPATRPMQAATVAVALLPQAKLKNGDCCQESTWYVFADAHESCCARSAAMSQPTTLRRFGLVAAVCALLLGCRSWQYDPAPNVPTYTVPPAPLGAAVAPPATVMPPAAV